MEAAMAQVTIHINGRTYQIACDDGQEANLTRLAKYVDQRVGQLSSAVGQVGQERLLAMASLLIADELSEAFTALERFKAGDGGADRRASEANEAIDRLAQRIEGVAERLGRP